MKLRMWTFIDGTMDTNGAIKLESKKDLFDVRSNLPQKIQFQTANKR